MTSWTAAPVKLVLLGGIAQQLHAGYDFLQNLNALNSIMTWYPQGQRLGTTIPAFLNWFNFLDDNQEVVIEVKAYLPDGSTTTKYIDNNFVGRSKEILIIPVGFKQLALDVTDPTALKWEVRVVDKGSDYAGGNPSYLSEVRRYYVDDLHYEDSKVLMYFNSFYVPEIAHFTGVQIKDLEVERDIRNSIITSGYKATDTEVGQFDETWGNTYTYTSGFISKKEKDALQEILIYNNVFEIYENGYLLILITGKKFNIKNSGEFLHSISFKAVNRLSMKNYSTEKQGITPGYWITPGGDTWVTPGGDGWLWG